MKPISSTRDEISFLVTTPYHVEVSLEGAPTNEKSMRCTISRTSSHIQTQLKYLITTQSDISITYHYNSNIFETTDHDVHCRCVPAADVMQRNKPSNEGLHNTRIRTGRPHSTRIRNKTSFVEDTHRIPGLWGRSSPHKPGGTPCLHVRANHR